jgi:hypothetical protein
LGKSRKGEGNEKKRIDEKVKRDHIVGDAFDHDGIFVRGTGSSVCGR